MTHGKRENGAKSMGEKPLDLASRLALRPGEAAQALGVSERTLRKWMRDESLPYFRVDGAVRIPVGDLTAWMNERLRSQQRTDDVAEEILREL